MSDQPMHESDPILGQHWLTRFRVKWVLVILSAITVAALAVAGFELVAERDHTDQQIHQLACLMVAPYPDDIPYVHKFRKQYDCPPYNPAIAKELIQKSGE